MTFLRAGFIAALLGLGYLSDARDADLKSGDGSIVEHDVSLANGETMPTLKLHYRTLGSPVRDAAGSITNAILLLHGTTGSADTLLARSFADALYGPGQPLDSSAFFLVIPDGIGAGASSKPSDGQHGRFPHYGYRDQVRAQHDLLAALGVKHVKLVLGTSMGGMQTWLWGEIYPNDMDGLVAIASTPAEISGRNKLWREMIGQAIRSDPNWNDGDYANEKPPRAWGNFAFPLFSIMTENAEQLQAQAPTGAKSAVLLRSLEGRGMNADASDFLYTFESSADYDPAPRLGEIVKPMLTINFADDLLNPPALLNLPNGRNLTAVMLPGGVGSYGHQTLTHAALWAPALTSFLETLPGWR